MKSQTGYEDSSEDEEEEIAPQERDWRIEEVFVGVGDGITVRVLLDLEPIGLLRVPNREYVGFLRRKLQIKEA